MKLTPLDIRRQEFKRVVRGIDPEEVSVFLDMVAGEFERILRESKAMSEERDELKRKVDELDSMKEAIHGAVVMAKKSSDEAVSQARKEAELRLKEAEVESERLLEDARRQAMLLKKEVDDIRNQRSILVGRLKSLLDGQMKMLEAYVGDWVHDERETPREPRENDYGDAGARRETAGSWSHEASRPADSPRPMTHADFLPNVPTDPAPVPDVRRSQADRYVPRILSREAETSRAPRSEEPFRAPTGPATPGERRTDEDPRPEHLQSGGSVDRPHFLRPPRPTLDEE